MNKLYLNLDGTFKSLNEIPLETSEQDIIDSIKIQSGEAPGFHVFVGDGLVEGDNSGKQVLFAASQGFSLFPVHE